MELAMGVWNDDSNGCDVIPAGDLEPAAQHLAIPPLNAQRYLEQLDELELPEEQKTEILNALWHIMATFVELGFGVDSVQNILPAVAEISFESQADGVEKEINSSLSKETIP